MHERLGLISINGARVHNDTLVRLGLTLPGLVERSHLTAGMPSLGLLTLAALTPADFDVQYLEFPELDVGALAATSFDIVAISSFTAKASVMYAIADFYRARGTTVVLGGLHCTQLPREAAEHADAVVIGEGERVWPRLLDDWRHGTLQKVYRTLSIRDVDLATVPAPRYDLLEALQYKRLPIQTSRGCPLDCEFCASSKIFGGYKMKPVASVVRDIRAAKEHFPEPFFELADDNTFVNKEWSRALVRAIGDEEVYWSTETDVSVGDDPALMDLLAGSGCRQVQIGFESPRIESLEGIEARNWKARRRDRHFRVIHDLQRRGVTVNGCFIVGLDHDTPDIFEEIERFVRGTGLMEVQVTVLTPFPGTALYRRLAVEGRLLQKVFWDRCTLFDVNFVPARMSVADLEQGLEYLIGALYSPAETRRRRRLHAQRTGSLRASEAVTP
jgi:radical SAM superfamily enzyme YgiQ (UPF0313 family)